MLSDVTVLITGPSEGGIGAQTALSLATANPALILLAGRSKDKVQPVINEIARINSKIPVKFVTLDLADLSSVGKAAENVKAITNKLDVLINNAGGKALL